MRTVLGLVAALIITAGWMVDPLGLRDRMAAEVRPDEETVKAMRAGAERIIAAVSVRAPDLADDERDARN
ncbi:MAG: hypothetical protein JJU26_03140 [Oceanicaulis sp.]|uniref:hypothetical protein n=1 Tax=Glycocaulis sp. TaxID=1969725 RepID=UPI0025C3582B|nr:hypothetical protein [Glycocaulis sp.]MCC5980695.1 hypothetical protein [Oceanicaulis sp.]MCH8522245.1 hypothetical protein [Glycocaulis sp.]